MFVKAVTAVEGELAALTPEGRTGGKGGGEEAGPGEGSEWVHLPAGVEGTHTETDTHKNTCTMLEGSICLLVLKVHIQRQTHKTTCTMLDGSICLLVLKVGAGYRV